MENKLQFYFIKSNSLSFFFNHDLLFLLLSFDSTWMSQWIKTQRTSVFFESYLSSLFFFLSNEWPDLTFGGHFHCSLFLHGYWCKPSSVPYYLIPGNIIKVFSFITPISISSAHPIQDTLINFTSYLRTNDDFHFKNHVWVLGTQSRVFSNWPQTYFSRSISTSTYYVCAWKTAQ